MKGKKFPLCLLLSAAMTVALLLPACEFKADGSIKSLTLPYIAQYTCVEARLGEKDILNEYEFITVTLLDRKEMELSFKRKDGEKKSYKSGYSFDPETHELTGEIGIFGYAVKQKIIVEKGGFVISHPVGNQTLYMKFQVNG